MSHELRKLAVLLYYCIDFAKKYGVGVLAQLFWRVQFASLAHKVLAQFAPQAAEPLPPVY